MVLLILLAGDIATNPGPTAGSKPTENSSFLRLNVLYLNARSLKAFVHPIGDKSVKICKISLLQQLTYSGNYDVVCVCETWLNSSVLNSEILPNYGSIFRCDRTGRIGGGVLVAVKTGIQVTRRHDLEPENTEIVVIELMKSNSKPVVLYTFYRPPNSTPDVLQSLNNSLQKNPESSRVIVIGDFNLPSVKWSSDQNTPISIGSSAENEAFCEMVEDNFLQQFLLSATHIAGNILDLSRLNVYAKFRILLFTMHCFIQYTLVKLLNDMQFNPCALLICFCLNRLIEPFPDINRFALSTSHGEENETKLQTLSTPP